MQEMKSVTAIVTMGGVDPNNHQWIMSYTLSYSASGSDEFISVTDDNGTMQVFDGNANNDNATHHDFATPIVARKVRLHPKSWYNGVTLRWGLIGCSYGKLKLSVSPPQCGRCLSFMQGLKCDRKGKVNI